MSCKTKLLEQFGLRHSVRILCATIFTGAAILSLSGRLAASPVHSSHDYFVYVGTYTSGESKGIYLYRFDEETGQMTSLGLAAETANPSFVITDPTHRYLYAVNEMADRSPDAPRGGFHKGTISSFAIDPKTGSLKFLNRVSSGGSGPCHLVDR